MAKKAVSHRFQITQDDVPSLYRSALISMGGVLLAIGFLFLIKYLLPDYDYKAIDVAVSTAVGAWVVNLVKVFVEQK